MGFAFHMMCLRYSGPLIITAPLAVRLWETYTFTVVSYFIEFFLKFFILRTQEMSDLEYHLSLLFYF